MDEKTKLNSGLRVVTHRMPQMRSVALGLWINIGGRYENTRNKGISHFLEHMLFKGSKKYSCHKIKESIEGIGGSLNGFTSEELTCYLVKVPSRYWDLALDVLSDMVLNPLLEVKEIGKEKRVILEEIKMYRDQPQSYVHELLDELLWPGQSLGEPIIGTFESVSGISRDNLSSFQDAHYVPANIVISAAGLIEHDQLLKKVKRIFPPLRQKEKNIFLPVKEQQGQPQLKVFTKDTEQTHLALGFHGFRRNHPLKHALGLMHIILGGNMSSRLFNELREKRGLAYEIGTQLRRYQDTGAFVVHAGIDNRKVKESIGLIMDVLRHFTAQLVREDEFRRAKEFYLGQLILSLEETMDYMLWIGETTATLDRTYSVEEVIRETKKVTREDLKQAAGKIFQENKINLALVGPLKEKKGEFINLLKLK